MKRILCALFVFGVTFVCYGQACNNTGYISVNMHFMLKSDGTGNFNEHDNGLPSANTAHNGYEYARNIINISNLKLQNNQKATAPPNNQIPVLPLPYRYVLSGVYFHRDDVFYVFDWALRSKMHNQYGVNRNTEINIYFSDGSILPNGEKDYGANASGYNCDDAFIVFVSSWTGYSRDETFPTNTSMEHENAHLFGIKHLYDKDEFGELKDDGCEDTPLMHSCEYNYENNLPQTNNVVGGWCGGDVSWSPCQINIIKTSLQNSCKPYSFCSAMRPAIAAFSLSQTYICTGEDLFLYGGWRDANSKLETVYRVAIYEVPFIGSDVVLGGYWQSAEYTGQYGDLNLKTMYTPGFKDGYYCVELEVGNSNNSHKRKSYFTVYGDEAATKTINGSSNLPGYNVLGYKSILVSNLMAQASSRSVMQAIDYISIDEVTSIEQGAVFYAYLSEGNSCGETVKPPQAHFLEEAATLQRVETQEVISCSRPYVAGQARIGDGTDMLNVFKEEADLLIMPVPAQHSVHVISPYPIQKIWIRNNFGILIFENEPHSVTDIEIDLEKLPAGVYMALIQLVSGENVKRTIVLTE